MGCVQGKPSMHSPPRGLEKLKQENGYIGNGGNIINGRRSTGQRDYDTDEVKIYRNESRRSSNVKVNVNVNTNIVTNDDRDRDRMVGGDDGERTVKSREGARKNAPIRGSSTKKRVVSEEESVDGSGWPQWLTANIPKEALAGVAAKSAESYDKISKIGQGTYSNVYKARDRDTGKIVALKKVRFDTTEPESIKFMAREIMILQKLDHPNIIKLEGLATSRMQFSLYLVFDFMLTDLARIISRPDERLTEPQVKSYMQQLLSGLQHCHERGILHRDIKGSNLLIDRDGMLKIADFGLANYFNSHKKVTLTSRVVTLWYRAPELLLGATDYGVGIDLWSAGCLMAEMFAGRPIMPGRTEVEQIHKIFKLCGTPSEEYWKKMKFPATFRPPQTYKCNLYDAFGAFPGSSLGLLSTLLALDPSYRGTASSALKNEFFYTSPLPCDLSGLPVLKKDDDEQNQANEKRRVKRSKMKKRSQTQRERKKKYLAAEIPKANSGSSKEDMEKTADSELVLRNQGHGNNSSSNNSSNLRKQDPGPVPAAPLLIVSSDESPIQTMASRTEAHPNARNNIKNPHVIPTFKTGTNYKASDNKQRLNNQVHRSASTREFRQFDQRKYPTGYTVDDLAT